MTCPTTTRAQLRGLPRHPRQQHPDRLVCRGLTAAQRKQVVDYFALTKQEGTARGMLRGVLASTAALAIIPMADWLEEAAAARMNTPGQAQGNWQWRADAKKLTPALAAEIRVLTERYFRAAK